MEKMGTKKIQLSKEEMKNIKGGMSETCKQIQEVGNHPSSKQWDDSIWDTWTDLYLKHCT